MHALANAADPYLIPSIVAAVGSVTAAAIAGAIAWRSQSYARLLEDIEGLVTKCIKKQLRRFVGDSRGRRWYDGPDGPEDGPLER